MTSKNASGDASQGKFWQKGARGILCTPASSLGTGYLEMGCVLLCLLYKRLYVRRKMQHLLCCQEKKESDNVRVAVRCRPLNQKEKESNFKMAIKVYLLLCYRYKYVVTFLQGHVFYSFDRWMSELDK